MTREEAIKVLSRYDMNFYDTNGIRIGAATLADAFDMAIEALEQEPKTGYWERIPYSVAGGFRCSLCHCKTLSKHWNYCPNCGAKMGSDKE